MVDKCNSCGARVITNPIWEGQEHGEKFSWAKIRWKNVFKVDLGTISFVLIILYIAWAYNADLDQYRDISENPCGFCADAATACSYKDNSWITGDVPDLNIVFDAIKTT